MTMEAVGIGKLVLLAVALALTLSMTGCAATGPGAPLNSHGVDYYPAFNPLDPKGGWAVTIIAYTDDYKLDDRDARSNPAAHRLQADVRWERQGSQGNDGMTTGNPAPVCTAIEREQLLS
jgi:hypothetical protein